MASICVCTPMYGGVCHGGYVKSLLQLKETLISHYHQFHFISIENESLIQRGRNTLVWYFLNKTNFTHLLFIDSDLAFNPEDVLKMLSFDKDIIGGIYPKKTINWDSVKSIMPNIELNNINKFTGEFVLAVDTLEPRIFFDQPFEVKHLGTGFMLIKRETFKKLEEHVGSYISNNYTDDSKQKTFNYFQVTVENNELLSEDYFFCNAFQKIGGKIYAAPWCDFEHNGNYRFSGSFVEHLKLQDGSFYKNETRTSS